MSISGITRYSPVYHSALQKGFFAGTLSYGVTLVSQRRIYGFLLETLTVIGGNFAAE